MDCRPPVYHFSGFGFWSDKSVFSSLQVGSGGRPEAAASCMAGSVLPLSFILSGWGLQVPLFFLLLIKYNLLLFHPFLINLSLEALITVEASLLYCRSHEPYV